MFASAIIASIFGLIGFIMWIEDKFLLPQQPQGSTAQVDSAPHHSVEPARSEQVIVYDSQSSLARAA
jgi:hypothetical protein